MVIFIGDKVNNYWKTQREWLKLPFKARQNVYKNFNK